MCFENLNRKRLSLKHWEALPAVMSQFGRRQSSEQAGDGEYHVSCCCVVAAAEAATEIGFVCFVK